METAVNWEELTDSKSQDKGSTTLRPESLDSSKRALDKNQIAQSEKPITSTPGSTYNITEKTLNTNEITKSKEPITPTAGSTNKLTEIVSIDDSPKKTLDNNKITQSEEPITWAPGSTNNIVDKTLDIDQTTHSEKPVISSSQDHNNSSTDISDAEKLAQRRARAQRFKLILLISISRLLYFVHSLLTIWRVAEVLGPQYWYMALWLITFPIEMLVVILRRKGKEWTWFQPIVMLYLMVELPAIFLLELEKASSIQRHYNQTAILKDLLGDGDKTKVDINNVRIKINTSTWALLLEQSMLVLIIVARWLKPKGDLTKEQLSGLLLSYLGTASDVVDFFSVLAEETKMLLQIDFLFTILATWAWSMLQFMFVTTMVMPGSNDDDVSNTNRIAPEPDATNNGGMMENGWSNGNGWVDAEGGGKKKRTSIAGTEYVKQKWTSGVGTLRGFVESEVWSIFVALVLQDGPYVVVRVVCVFYWGIRTYTNYFFTFKNCMMLTLQIYRLVSVYQNKQDLKEKIGKDL